MDLIFQTCGWVSALGLLTAFYMNSRNKLSPDNRIYQRLNFGCALLLTVNAIYIGSYPFL